MPATRYARFHPTAGLLLLLATVALAGCGGVSRTHRAELSKLSYPQQAERGPGLEIHVERAGDRIRLANAEPRAFHNMQIWLNRGFVQRIETVAIGSENYYRLGRFVNRHGETYPLAGWLSPRQTEPVVMAELYDPDTDVRHPLIVQPDETEDE